MLLYRERFAGVLQAVRARSKRSRERETAETFKQLGLASEGDSKNVEIRLPYHSHSVSFKVS